MSTSVCVVGAVNMDLFLRTPRWVQPGETLLAESVARAPGGKGANQAVAAGRMGAQVSLVGRVGDDVWGGELRTALTAEGIDLQHLRVSDKAETGLAIVTLVPENQNTILVAPGSNAEVGREDVEAASEAIASADVLLLQCELSAEANLRAAELAGKDTLVVLNAAPARELEPELVERADLLIVNRSEAKLLTGETNGVSPKGLCRRLASLGAERVVVTLGVDGAAHFDGTDMESFEGFEVEVADPTGAGDAFVGTLSVLRHEGHRMPEAVRLACAAGALATTTAGAIPALPSREATEALAGVGH